MEQFKENKHAKIAEMEGLVKVYKTECEENMAITQKRREKQQQQNTFESTKSMLKGLDGKPLPQACPGIAFSHIKHLGHGSYASVEAVQLQFSNEILVRKVISCTSKAEFEAQAPLIEREVDALKSLQHHHIVTMRLFISDQKSYAFSIMMSPVGDGDLSHYLEDEPSSGRFRFNPEFDTWFGCLASGLHFAHVKRVIHQDIKPKNIIIKDGQPLLTDFGTAKDFSMLDSSISRDEMVCGTVTYLPPETRPGMDRGRAADIFSLGCVFAEMLTVREGRTLEEFRGSRELPNALTNVSPFRDNLQAVSDWLSRFTHTSRSRFIKSQIQKMLQETPGDRPRAVDLKRKFRGEDLLCDLCC